MPQNEAFARIKVDELLRDRGWDLTDGKSVRFELPLPDGTKTDDVLFSRQGHPLAVLKAKRSSLSPVAGRAQGLAYAAQLDVPFVFLSNGEQAQFMGRDIDAHARDVATIFGQDDLERRMATRRLRRDLAHVTTDCAVAGRDYQLGCIDALCAEVSAGRCKLLVEITTGTGKTRTAAAFVKRLFEAGHVTRVLFLVDRIALASQALDAFVAPLKDYPAYVLRAGGQFDHAKRITIATLQTMVSEYDALSSGYFDLVITDECHRSIYGKWSGVLRHFDGIQLGLTATPAVSIPPTCPMRKTAAQGYRVEAVFPDDVSGGGDFMKRPGMVALLSYLDAQKSGQDADEGYVVIFDDLKRFARDTEFHLKLRKAFQARDARVECLNFKFEDTPEGKFIETILAAQGALEREQNGRQVVQKMRARLQGGYWVFKAPVGYRYDKHPIHGKLLVRDEPMATQITEALEGYASGRFDSQAEVKRFLESQPEFPKTAKGTVRQTEVTDILTRPT